VFSSFSHSAVGFLLPGKQVNPLTHQPIHLHFKNTASRASTKARNQEASSVLQPSPGVQASSPKARAGAWTVGDSRPHPQDCLLAASILCELAAGIVLDLGLAACKLGMASCLCCFCCLKVYPLAPGLCVVGAVSLWMGSLEMETCLWPPRPTKCECVCVCACVCVCVCGTKTTVRGDFSIKSRPPPRP
jgi:hypothetical protein